MLENFFAARKRLYPQSVKGRFRRLKWVLNVVFLTIYFGTPFMRFERAGAAPDQGLLIDFLSSKIYFFFVEIWPQEVYYLAGILIIAAVMLFFVTSLFGRIWCGYACFQTVWTDIFIGFERLFQGDRNSRILLDRRKNFEKFWRKFLTHISWVIVSLLTGWGFVCYFNDAILLTKNIFHGQIEASALGWILGIAAATYVMAGFAREQVCTYMCPYSRFQSAMFDKNTLIITYDEKRGEPRGKQGQGNGDCIDCKQCVVVCPTGIDIRDGLQMECIACGLCVDACDNIMAKIGLPKGLIRYDTMDHLLDPNTAKKFKILKPRTFFYATILTVVCAIMLRNLILKPVVEISAIPDRNPIFVTLSDGSIRNGYTIKIANKTHEKKVFNLKISTPSEAVLKLQNGDLGDLEVAADEVGTFKVFAILPKDLVAKSDEGRGLLEFVITGADRQEAEKIQAVFIGK
ncbi:MAG: cytochrome c oxidase accessory protein CcoG [Rickettsiales bacterium]|nr:cytochrome c oxidase accessory protein CcoG [Rickettsiales bacterium]